MERCGGYFFSVFLEHIPVFGEIFHTGIYRGHQDDPLADIVQPLGDAEEYQADADHGAGGLDLAGPPGCDDPALLHGHQAHTADGELPQQHHGQDPAANPEAVCVACGGMADDEIITEARCIRDELVRRGIAPGRIYLEEKSLNTRQNISYAADIIRANGLPTEAAVASDNFHQLRAAIYARGSGLEVQSLGCRSYWLLGPGYWAREVIAVAAAWAFGR